MKHIVVLIAWLIITAIAVSLGTNAIQSTSIPIKEKLIIGPHSPSIWFRDATLSANGDIQVTGRTVFVVHDQKGNFVTSGLPGRIPVGKKDPTFTSSFVAQESLNYITSVNVSVFALTDTSITYTTDQSVYGPLICLLIFILWAFSTVILQQIYLFMTKIRI